VYAVICMEKEIYKMVACDIFNAMVEWQVMMFSKAEEMVGKY